jgi:Ca2+-binding EF-hand superfamily protein
MNISTFAKMLAVGLLCGAGVAQAQAQSQDRNKLLDDVRQFEVADHDGDKALSWEEFRNYLIQMFHAIDHDGNGIIQGDEHPPSVDAAGKPVAPADVTAEAFNVEVRRAFVRADKDKSGDLNYAEYAGKS